MSRRTVEFTVEDETALDEIQAVLRTKSRTETFRQAIRLARNELIRQRELEGEFPR